MEDNNTAVQPLFDEMLAARQAKRKISAAIKSELEGNRRYREAMDEKKAADAKMKMVKAQVLEDLLADTQKMEDASEEEASVKVAVEIAAVKEILAGRTVRVSDGRKKLILKPTYRAEKEN
jgi:hypothetical protein